MSPTASRLEPSNPGFDESTSADTAADNLRNPQDMFAYRRGLLPASLKTQIITAVQRLKLDLDRMLEQTDAIEIKLTEEEIYEAAGFFMIHAKGNPRSASGWNEWKKVAKDNPDVGAPGGNTAEHLKNYQKRASEKWSTFTPEKKRELADIARKNQAESISYEAIRRKVYSSFVSSLRTYWVINMHSKIVTVVLLTDLTRSTHLRRMVTRSWSLFPTITRGPAMERSEPPLV